MHTKRWILFVGAVMAVVSMALFAAGCKDDKKDNGGGTTPTTEATTAPAGETATAEGTATTGSTVEVNLTEFLIAPDPASVPAGSVTFNVHNIGGEMHEMVLFKTDLAEDALPTKDDGSVDESGSGLQKIGEAADIAAGEDGSLTATLEPGSYVLICNIVEEMDTGETHVHYEKGMHKTFEVTA